MQTIIDSEAHSKAFTYEKDKGKMVFLEKELHMMAKLTKID